MIIDNNANPEWKKLKVYFRKADELKNGKVNLNSAAEELINLCKCALRQQEYWFAFIGSKALVGDEQIASKYPEVEILMVESMYKLNQFEPALNRISELKKSSTPLDERLLLMEQAIKNITSIPVLDLQNPVPSSHGVNNLSSTEFFPSQFAEMIIFKLFDSQKSEENKTYLSAVNRFTTPKIGVEMVVNNKMYKINNQTLNCFLGLFIDDVIVEQKNFDITIPQDWDATVFTQKFDTTINPLWSDGEARLELYLNKTKIAVKTFIVGEETIEEKNEKTATTATEPDFSEDGIASVMEELEEIIGLNIVKDTIRGLIDYLDFMRERKTLGLKAKDQITVHSIFLGNPGTGKTTVARLMGRIFKGMGLLTKGEVIEVDRSALVGQYVGETAQKTEKIIEDSIGNVLFIDEAYTLVKKGGGNDFGQEAIDVLLKRMEDRKGEFFVIVAGYPNEMQDFLDANPGLRSRFTHTFNFEDYQPDELLEIFKKLVKDEDYRIADDAEKALLKELGKIYRTRDKNFGNARTVRKLFEDAKLEVSRRYLSLPRHDRTQEKLTTIYRVDIDSIVGAPKEKATANLPINEEMLAEALTQLEGLTGLLSVKKEIREMVKLARFYKEQGENISDKFMSHILFLGSPGTGKTTVARIVSKIYSAIAILPGGQLIETDRSGLVSGYVGQTAEKTTNAINSSIGGTLFIDEAYTLVKGGENDFGKEAIDTLLKRMEDDKGKFVVIAAGYTDEMKAFLESNPGMRSRFTKTFFFEDYIPDDLMKIFDFLCRKEGLRIDETTRTLLLKHFNLIYRNRDKNFGNARIVRNIFDSANRNRILRLAGGSMNENKSLFIPDDFPELNKVEPERRSTPVQGDSDKLEIVLEELNRLTGLEAVKENVARLVSSLKISRMRRERGMDVIQKPLHAVFTGGPGTGKTTVARLLSNIFRELGVVQKGHLVEVDRAQLVAGYAGQTAIKTDEIIKKALGGVLFIDEAYTLARGSGDLGQEAIDTLLKRMEDYKDDLVVIVAGYQAEMRTFIESNPGLQSRFTHEFYFEDYNPDQLESIVKGMAAKNGYKFDQTGADTLYNQLVKLYNNRDKNFGNARTARNILLKIITNQEERISTIIAPSNSDLQLLKQEDIPRV